MTRTIGGAFLAALCCAIPNAASAGQNLFGTAEFKANSHAGLPKWDRLLERIEKEKKFYEQCRTDHRLCDSRGAKAWQSMLRGLEGAPLRTQLREINRFVNRWHHKDDERNFGLSDHWATPLEFFRQSGDCEDYAITKYVSMRLLGLPSERMRMVVLRDELRELPHAVLAVYHGDEIAILDNVTNAILSHGQLSHYVPYYSVNETARWSHVQSGEVKISALAGYGR